VKNSKVAVLLLLVVLAACPGETDDPSEIISVTITDAAATVLRGGTIQFDVVVNTKSGGNKSVEWDLSGGNGSSSISSSGQLTVSLSETAGTMLTVSAVSVYDPEKSDSRVVTVMAGQASVYSVNFADYSYGTVVSSLATALDGETVTLTVTPDEYFYLASITVIRSGGFSVPLTEIVKDTVLSFTMPNSSVTVRTVFRDDEEFLFTNPGLLWYDDFSGTSLDTTKWNIDLGNGSQYSNNNWGNNELQYYRAENLIVKDGKLTIEAKNESFGGKSYTSGKITTAGIRNGTTTSSPMVPYRYFAHMGRVEAKMRLPKGQGFWPAFWMLGANQGAWSSYNGSSTLYTGIGWARCGEIDIMESRGHTSEIYGSAIHYGNPYGNQAREIDYHESLADDWHVYGIAWDVNTMKFLFDGEAWYTINLSSIGDLKSCFTFEGGYSVILNLALGGNYLPASNRTPLASSFTTGKYEDRCLEVDWVRVLEN